MSCSATCVTTCASTFTACVQARVVEDARHGHTMLDRKRRDFSAGSQAHEGRESRAMVIRLLGCSAVARTQRGSVRRSWTRGIGPGPPLNQLRDWRPDVWRGSETRGLFADRGVQNVRDHARGSGRIGPHQTHDMRMGTMVVPVLRVALWAMLRVVIPAMTRGLVIDNSRAANNSTALASNVGGSGLRRGAVVHVGNRHLGGRDKNAE